MTDATTARLDEWAKKQTAAEDLIPLVGRLYRENDVLLTLFGRSLLNKSVTGMIKAHRYARHFLGEELDIAITHKIVTALAELDLGPARIDLGRLVEKMDDPAGSIEEFLATELAEIVGSQVDEGESRDVVLYGFGRIGRLLARILIDRAGGTGMRLRAIVVRKGGENDIVKRASLLRRDSVHGKFDGTIVVDEEANTIQANGTLIQVIYSDDPSQVDYTAYGITDAIIVDNTGKWRDEEGLSKHLACPGASKVLLTAPGKGEVKNIVYGVNDAAILDTDTVMSAASCTTNAITPVLKAIHDRFGVRNGHVETVHSFTNDQNLIDNFHKGSRRGRAAGLNMVLTETGAAKAVAKALPELKGKLSGNAIRVPTPNVSMAILNLNLETATDVEELNAFLRETSMHSSLRNQVDYVTSPELVSSDLVGSKRAGVVDGLATIVDEDRVVVYVWYDNEFGYSCQVVRCVAKMTGVDVPAFP
ncbi:MULTISPECIES: glyceraldehyde-3-phosphate dehydrogenase [unclassified Brevibacterium]|uniref:glyceraldehyde-3-phosphate dehydrogenase n=1 Tax=unclassified Brevibacterium TaxID=2614124 RepID=UPI001E2ED53A|nr:MULTISPECIES: glyceraldehyde-3-phosphate dehydrogenase [unclassified Brevibacterium]MCD1285062.1 glyceraldehyde-3-phosphate dehydrogenase [Brevibacterium sp. CCUG 69071]MDK8435315.1 glyceraldehyde-3-phosphate dehydrogenase [Brevibacterium sp. H-BE7]